MNMPKRLNSSEFSGVSGKRLPLASVRLPGGLFGNSVFNDVLGMNSHNLS